MSALSVRALSVELDGARILDDVTTAVAPGEWVALIGPNGAGKSTFLRAVARLVSYSGSVELDGEETGRLGRRGLARRLAFVPQAPLLPAAMTVREYVLLGRTPHIGSFGHEGQRDLEAAAAALAAFRGVGRRFERLGEVAGIALVDDYAHHPTEVRATLAAARQAFPGRRLVAVFQPHLYSRTAQHGDALGDALAAADLVIVTDVYPAREAPIPGVTGERVANAARDRGIQTVYEPVRDALGERVASLVRAGDVVLTLGAGDITRLGPELQNRLESHR